MVCNRYQCVFAYVIAFVVYQFGMMFTGNGNVIAFIIAIALVAFLLYMLFRPYKESTSLKANTVSSVKAASK